ncbi:glycerate kinase [Georgenia sp. 10Sc9-8]|uniref:Glycerate kinase n=1 Tax=Georgenia halotolerans TaxID=3028317 RepID=A0ABT5U049_9MICO|nr:glycerate kinase [Georgenia halotolerans]
MRVLVAPDRFSGALTAAHAAGALARGWSERVPDDDVVQVPMSDGTAGLLDVVHAACGGRLTSVTVRGPLGAPVPAAVLHVPGTGGGTAYLEGDQVLGRHLVPADQRRHAAGQGSSSSLGELLAAGLATGAGRLVVGLPLPAAVHDGGAGVLAALSGAPADHPLRAGGRGLASLTADDLAGFAEAAERLSTRDVVLAVPDDAPLLGLHGAGAVLGQQAEVGPDLAQELERALGHGTDLVERLVRPRRTLPQVGQAGQAAAGHDHSHGPDGHRHGPDGGGRLPTGGRAVPRLARSLSTGAGGGAAFLLTAMGARALPGADVVAEAVGLPADIAAADLVLTGAGVLDAPSLTRSVVATVGRHAMSHGLPVVVVADEVRTSRREVAQIGVSGAYEVIHRRRDGSTAGPVSGVAVEDLARRAARLAGTWSP